MKRIVISTAGVLFLGWLLCLPWNLFRGTPYSTVVLDSNGELIGARTASDGQWRFPPCDSVPYKYAVALVQFEDRAFRYHPGVNPLALGRAFVQNIRSGRVVSGASTITMQVARLSCNARSSRPLRRSVWQKMKEGLMATQLEFRYSKDRILALYASHAPFGSNVVGLEAASWRYFGYPSAELSWAQAATLAVLPNSPSLIHPGKNSDKLLAKRNSLLLRLFEQGYISRDDYELSCEEPLPGPPKPLPRYAPHLIDMYQEKAPGVQTKTDINLELQKKVGAIVSRWSDSFACEGIADMCAVVIDVHSGGVLAYIGNSSPQRERTGRDVDVLQAPRSTGSILKPFLYCAMLQDGEILPNTLLADVPLNVGGFTPRNFNLSFDGAVPAGEALSRSLNVPFVNLLREYSVPRFLELLRSLGLGTLNRTSDDYGLSLILGGAEARPLEVAKVYACMSAAYQNEYWARGFPLEDKAALWYTFGSLREVNRADQMDWHLLNSLEQIAWKTGTSYGFRDAWAMGVTKDYAVGVWAGNASGEGTAGLLGARTAGAVLFDIFNSLPQSDWFDKPAYGEYVYAPVCRQSGHLAGADCELRDTIMLPRAALRSKVCPYHSPSGFTLPPAMGWYYRKNHPEYAPAKAAPKVMEFIYPASDSRITIPRRLDGTPGVIVFSLAHNDPSSKVFWHLDSSYEGETSHIHQLSLSPSPGRHVITVVDTAGNTLSAPFTVL